MKKITVLLITIFNLQFVSSQVPGSLKSEIENTFSNWSNKTEPGISAGIIKDGKIIFLKGFGIANMETNTLITPQTKFQLGELSKQFTSLAILVLLENGKIKLNEDIRKYIPELHQFKHKITISHLLNHTSGLHDVNKINLVLRGSSEVLTQKRALKLIASQKNLSYIPGIDFSFHESVTESILMAEIVSRSSGLTFAEFIKKKIFEPLGMNNSLIRDDNKTIITNVAEPYQKSGENIFKKNYVQSNVVGAINAYSTAEDLAKWYLNFSNPKGKLGLLIQKLDTPVRLNNGEKFSYYWGEMVFGREFTHPERGLPIFWNFGLQGGYGTNVFRYIDQNIISFVLGNSSQYNGAAAMNAIEPFVKNIYLDPPIVNYNTLKTKKLSNKKLKSFEGNYWFKKAGYATKLFVKNDTLRNQWIFSSRSSKLIPINRNTFQQVGTTDEVRLYNFKKNEEGLKLYFTYNESKPDIMEKYTPVNPSLQKLKLYTGIYYNENYSTLFSFDIENGQLVVKNLNHETIKFKPVIKNVFTSTSPFFNSIEFLKDNSNNIKGFLIDTDGIHKLIFKKISSN